METKNSRYFSCHVECVSGRLITFEMTYPAPFIGTEIDQSEEAVRKVIALRDGIPLLNLFPTFATIKNGVVVRFRCMIQDSLDKVLKHKSFGGIDLRFRRGIEGVEGDSSSSFSSELYDVDRYTAVSVPGEILGASIALEDLAGFYTACTSDGERIQESEDPPKMVPVGDEEERIQETFTSPHPIPACLARPGESRVSAILNVCMPEVEYKLHDVVEVLGVVHHHQQEDGGGDIDFSIQVITMDVIKPYVGEHAVVLSKTQIEEARSALKCVLSKLLCQDELAAEYMLLQLVSERIKSSAGSTLGSWSLNLANAGSVDADLLTKFIRSVTCESFISVPCSNETLMKHRFYPLRSSESDFTAPGILQLPEGSTVLLDERHLAEGNVNALNVLAITKAVREQKLMGIFGSGHVLDFEVNTRFIILNSGNNKSIFANTNPSSGIVGSVPFVSLEIVDQRRNTSSTPPLGIIDISLSDKNLSLVRDYIRFCRQILPKVTITEDVINEFQNDWVHCRKNDESIPTDDIEAWATLLRCLPASMGSTETSIDGWKTVLQLETARRERSVNLDTMKNAAQAVVTGA